MPVYLCLPGHASLEPWRHGVQVYAYPFRIDGAASAAGVSETAAAAAAGTIATSGAAPSASAAISHDGTASPQQGDGGGAGDGDGVVAPGTSARVPVPGNPLLRRRLQSAGAGTPTGRPSSAGGNTSEPSLAAAAVAASAQLSGGGQRPQDPPHRPMLGATDRAASAGVGVAVRRVRHAEVVLADEVSASYGRYWLRLRWPGPRGGVAGYIALGVVPPADGDDGNAKSGVGADAEHHTGTDVALTNSSSVTSAGMAGALSGEREFQYRTQMSGELKKRDG